MDTQSFSNHVRIHPLYHYMAVPVSLLLIPASIVNLVMEVSLAGAILVIATIVLHLAIFLARDYAKKNQDRIIRAELRLRYYLLTQQSLEEIEGRLNTGQLLALRFASDHELLVLAANPETIGKTPDQIKRSIVDWKADLMRV
jgi:hypothetical protein